MTKIKKVPTSLGKALIKSGVIKEEAERPSKKTQERENIRTASRIFYKKKLASYGVSKSTFIGAFLNCIKNNHLESNTDSEIKGFSRNNSFKPYYLNLSKMSLDVLMKLPKGGKDAPGKLGDKFCAYEVGKVKMNVVFKGVTGEMWGTKVPGSFESIITIFPDGRVFSSAIFKANIDTNPEVTVSINCKKSAVPCQAPSYDILNSKGGKVVFETIDPKKIPNQSWFGVENYFSKHHDYSWCFLFLFLWWWKILCGCV